MLFILCALQLALAARPGEWRTRPLVYGISPYFLSLGRPLRGLEAVRRRLPELDELGVNVVWLQPIMPSAEPGHGYDVIDFTRINPELGNAQDLRALVRDAHARHMRVLLDFVPNHSSDAHPFAKDVAARGAESPYFNYYQHAPLTDVAYGEHQHVRQIGLASFVYYFWENLLNFDYGNPNLRAYVTGVMETWLRDFDVDGFRLDAAWGPAARHPGYLKEVGAQLRKRKPDLIVLAEAPNAKGSALDWTYDWDADDPDWVSRWSFSLDPERGEDVFNATNRAAAADRARLVLARPGIHPLRYLENNDTAGFLREHTPEQADFALAFTLTLPGVPLVFHGQETGNAHAIFDLPSFDPERPMGERNPSLRSRYKELLAKRLTRGEIRDLKREGATGLSFRRGRDQIKVDFGALTVEVNGTRWR